jgi:hypothetical protein
MVTVKMRAEYDIHISWFRPGCLEALDERRVKLVNLSHCGSIAAIPIAGIDDHFEIVGLSDPGLKDQLKSAPALAEKMRREPLALPLEQHLVRSKQRERHAQDKLLGAGDFEILQ